MEMESMEDGYLAKIIVEAGADMIPVGQPVAVIVESAEDVAAFANFTAADAGGAAAAAPPKTEAEAPARAITERPDYRPTAAQGVTARPRPYLRAPRPRLASQAVRHAVAFIA